MQPPMFGSWSVVVHAVQPFAIHGDLYYELIVTLLEEQTGQGVKLRVPQHAVAGQPKVGDRLSLSFLMGQVTSAAPIEP